MARKLLKRTAVVVVVALITLLAVRAWDSTRGAPLEPWHTFVPTELSAKELAQADWAKYVAAENAIFDQVSAEVTRKLPED